MGTLFLVFVVCIASVLVSLSVALYDGLTMQAKDLTIAGFIFAVSAIAFFVLCILVSKGGISPLLGVVLPITRKEDIRAILITMSRRVKFYNEYQHVTHKTAIGKSLHSVLYNKGCSGRCELILTIGEDTYHVISNLSDFCPNRLVEVCYSFGDSPAIDARARDTTNQQRGRYDTWYATMSTNYLIQELIYTLSYLHIKELNGRMSTVESWMRGFLWRYLGQRVSYEVLRVSDNSTTVSGKMTTEKLKANYLDFRRMLLTGYTIGGKPIVTDKTFALPTVKNVEGKEGDKQEADFDLSAFLVK